eukprot:72156-Rhodomonas_salina.1
MPRIRSRSLRGGGPSGQDLAQESDRSSASLTECPQTARWMTRDRRHRQRECHLQRHRVFIANNKGTPIAALVGGTPY